MSVLHVPNFVWGWIEAYHSLNLLTLSPHPPQFFTVLLILLQSYFAMLLACWPSAASEGFAKMLNTDGHSFSVKTWNSFLFQLFEWRGKEQKFHRNLLHLYTTSVRATLVPNEEIFSSCVARLQEDIMSFPGRVWWSFPFPVAVDAGENLEFTRTFNSCYLQGLKSRRVASARSIFFRSPGADRPRDLDPA